MQIDLNENVVTMSSILNLQHRVYANSQSTKNISFSANYQSDCIAISGLSNFFYMKHFNSFSYAMMTYFDLLFLNMSMPNSHDKNLVLFIK